jgi:hypothetical protein
MFRDELVEMNNFDILQEYPDHGGGEPDDDDDDDTSSPTTFQAEEDRPQGKKPS